jgi:hypothetical protein
MSSQNTMPDWTYEEEKGYGNWWILFQGNLVFSSYDSEDNARKLVDLLNDQPTPFRPEIT